MDDKKYDNLNDYIKNCLVNLQNKYIQNEIKKNPTIKSKNLIPQFFWGDTANTENMKAVILAKNPSFNIEGKSNDLKDNKNLASLLKDNLNIDSRTHEIRDLLFISNYNGYAPYFSKWWMEAFNELGLNDMQGIAIYNLFGFYSKNFPSKIDVKESHINYFDEIKKRIETQIRNSQCVFLMWISSWLLWKKILGEDIFKGKTIYVVNARGNCNHILKNSVPMTVEELDNHFDNYSEEIINIFKNQLKD